MTNGVEFAPTLARILGLGMVLLLGACGDSRMSPPASGLPVPPPSVPLAAEDAPVVDLGDYVHVGSDVAVSDAQLMPTPRHDAVAVSYGRVGDGLGAAELLAYLHDDATAPVSSAPEGDPEQEFFPDGLLLRFQAAPPTVRVTDGARPEWIDETVRVVQLLNAALPLDWQIRFDHAPGPHGPLGPPDGEILVEFAPQADWSLPDGPPVGEQIGLAAPQYTIVPTGNPAVPWLLEIIGGQVWVDPTRTHGNERLGVIAHEILHVLGRQHADPLRFPETIMVPGGGYGPTRHVLHPLDREALFAVYDRFETSALPNTLATNLGHWSDTSVHVLGTLDIPGGEVEFGAGLRNGLLQPWVLGPDTDQDLVQGEDLTGSATWSGRLLGLTPQAEVVAGAAELSVDIPALTGHLAFTGLEMWASDAAPGGVGTGSPWLDGDLSFGIAVRGNTFVGTGGEAGTVTGAFFGESHKGMGGVLRRSDFSGGFGGRR